jgi:porphobilinogen synthase
MFSKLITAENSLSINDLIMPLFIVEGKGLSQPIESMPNIFRYSTDKLLTVVEQIVALGIPAIALFPNIENSLKDETGSLALNSKKLNLQDSKTD